MDGLFEFEKKAYNPTLQNCHSSTSLLFPINLTFTLHTPMAVSTTTSHQKVLLTLAGGKRDSFFEIEQQCYYMGRGAPNLQRNRTLRGD